MHKQKVTKLGSRKFDLPKKLSKIWSKIDHGIDCDGVGAVRSHICIPKHRGGCK